VLEIESIAPLASRLSSYFVDEALAVTGVPIGDLPLPEGSAVALVVRGVELVAPTPATILEPGDHVYLLARHDDLAHLHLLFGRAEGDGDG